jgi:hypothetical protein
MDFLTELSGFCSRNKDPILIGGDLNIIRYSNERNKPRGAQRFSGTFNTLIDFHELRELVMTGGKFTWSNNQDVPLLEQLDRILVTKEWEDMFPNVIVKKLPREISDHNPLILSCGPNKNKKPLQFKFEQHWLTNPDFIQVVKKIWERPCRAKTSIDKIQQKLKLIKQYFKGWGLNLQSELRKKRASISAELSELEEIEEERELEAEQFLKKVELIKEILNLLD